MSKIKNELGHIYGDFIVIKITDEREAKNGCVKWLCTCRYCGATKMFSGNNLRFHQNKRCYVCKRNLRR